LLQSYHWSPKFRPITDPFHQCAGLQKFNQLHIFTTCTYSPNFMKIDAHNFQLLW